MIIRFGRNDFIDTKEIAKLVEDSKTSGATEQTQEVENPGQE